MRALPLLGAGLAAIVAAAFLLARRPPAPGAESLPSVAPPAEPVSPPSLQGRGSPGVLRGTMGSPSGQAASVTQAPDSEYRLRSDPASDPWWVEGRLLDPAGRPLAGVPVYLAFGDPKGYEHADQRVRSTRGTEIENGLAEARHFEAFGVTSDEGAFRLDSTLTRGLQSLSPATVRVVPSHPAWMEAKRATGQEGGDLRVEPAVSLTVRVVDRDGLAIPEMRAIVREESRKGDQGIAATDGGFVVQWRRGEELPPTVHPSLLIWARGRPVERRQVVIAGEESAASVTVEMGSVQPDGRIVLRPAHAGTALGDRTVIASLCLPERPEDEILRVIAVSEGAQGSRVAAVPIGRYVVRVWAWNDTSEARLLEETVDVASGGTVELRWPTPEWLPR